MLMEETACTAGEPTQVSVSEHMGTLACLNEHVCVHVCRNRYSVVSTYAREQFKLCFGAWKREIEKSCAFCFFCVCVCVCLLTLVCMCETINEWLKPGAWVSSKTAGCLHQLFCDDKINIRFAKAVTGNDAVIEMYDLLWLTQMDTYSRWGQNRWYTH